MPNFRLDRRTFIRGAGGIAIALPFLEIMRPEQAAFAADASKPALKHFLAVYQPGGTVRKDANGVDKWSPTGTETSFKLSPILAPLAPLQKKMLIIDGMDMLCAGSGEQHQGGIIGLLTGSQQANNNGSLGYATGPSIDQVIAKKLYNANKKKSIQMAVRWATGKSHGALSPINCVNFDADNNSPIGPAVDPQQIWKDLFSDLGANGATESAATTALARKKSILDFVDKRYATLAGRLGAADKLRLQEHLSKIRDLETSLSSITNTSSSCKQVPGVSTTDYNPHPAYSDNGSVVDGSTDAAIPKVGKFMMDMMVMALSCNMAPVGTLQWSDTEAKHTFPWLNLAQKQHHHFYQHDGGFQPVQCEQIGTWYATQHLYLLQAMDAVDVGGHSLLDETLVFFGSELQEPPTHKKNNLPLWLAGGGINTGTAGRWIKKSSEPHNNLLVSILNLFGDTRKTFGTASFCTGPTAGIV